MLKRLWSILFPPVEVPVTYPHMVTSVPFFDIDRGMRAIRWLLEHPWNRFPLTPIKPVRTNQDFPGWGYIEGTTKGWRVDSQITVVRGDDDLYSSERCILIDGVPVMMLEMRCEQASEKPSSSWRVRVIFIGRDTENRVLVRGRIFERKVDYDMMTSEAKRIIFKVMQAADNLAKIPKPDPINKMKDYRG